MPTISNLRVSFFPGENRIVRPIGFSFSEEYASKGLIDDGGRCGAVLIGRCKVAAGDAPHADRVEEARCDPIDQRNTGFMVWSLNCIAAAAAAERAVLRQRNHLYAWHGGYAADQFRGQHEFAARV